MIFDLQGTLIESHVIDRSGRTQIRVEGGALKAGMYIYTLMVDQKEMDTKRMILTK